MDAHQYIEDHRNVESARRAKIRRFTFGTDWKCSHSPAFLQASLEVLCSIEIRVGKLVKLERQSVRMTCDEDHHDQDLYIHKL